MRGTGERTEFAKHIFDETNKLAALFMMYTHGVGRWPSSRTALCQCTTTATVTGKQCEDSDFIVMMDTSPPPGKALNMLSHKKFKKKIRYWHVDTDLSWSEQEEVIKHYVRDLVIECDKDDPYKSIQKKASFEGCITLEGFLKCSNFDELRQFLNDYGE